MGSAASSATWWLVVGGNTKVVTCIETPSWRLLHAIRKNTLDWGDFCTGRTQPYFLFPSNNKNWRLSWLVFLSKQPNVFFFFPPRSVFFLCYYILRWQLWVWWEQRRQKKLDGNASRQNMWVFGWEVFCFTACAFALVVVEGEWMWSACVCFFVFVFVCMLCVCLVGWLSVY